MRITQLRFRAFKSLYDVACDLDQFTVLTGPNSAGKSNLVDAINFLSETFAHGLEIAAARAGGFDNIIYRRNGDSDKAIRFDIEIGFTGEDVAYLEELRGTGKTHLSPKDNYWLNLSFAMERSGSNDSPGDFRIIHERLVFRDGQKTFLRMSRGPEGIVHFRRSREIHGPRSRYGRALWPLSEDGFIDFIKSRPAKPTALSLAQLQLGGLLTEIVQSYGRSRVFQLSPHQCRQTGVPTPNAYLDRYGTNLPSVADYMRRNRQESWQQVESAMRSVVPQLKSIETSYTDDRRLALHFYEEGLERPWNSSEVSDGTIQILALFVALFDERTSFLAVEEPENALHPWILRQFVDLCREQSKQILLTTHSPVLVDYVLPESLRLVWQRAGRSFLARVTDLSPEFIVLWKAGDLRTFEAYDSGLIDEYIPERFLPIADHAG